MTDKPQRLPSFRTDGWATPPRRIPWRIRLGAWLLRGTEPAPQPTTPLHAARAGRLHEWRPADTTPLPSEPPEAETAMHALRRTGFTFTEADRAINALRRVGFTVAKDPYSTLRSGGPITSIGNPDPYGRTHDA